MRKLTLLSAAVAMLTLAGLARAQDPPANEWTPVGDGAFALPDAGWPDLLCEKLVWMPDRNRGLVAPLLTERPNLYALRSFSLEKPQWVQTPVKLPEGYRPDLWGTPRAITYLPSLGRVLVLRMQWHYSPNKKPVSGWLIDPDSGQWEPIEDDVQMSDSPKELGVPARGNKRLPLWGELCYDPINKEAVAIGGAATWGRLGKDKGPVAPGQWFFDEPAKRVRRLTPGEPATQGRRWYPSNCGTWVFGETSRKWSAIDQPLAQQPSARILPGVAFDADAGKIVLFGGDDLSRCLGDTWVYDCKSRTWSQVKTPVAPAARAGQAMIYLPESKLVLLAGGYGGGWKTLSDVWTFSTATGQWTRLSLELPKGVSCPSGVFDARSGLVVMAAYKSIRGNKAIPVLTIKLDLSKLTKLAPEPGDPRMDYHCVARDWELLPDEWLAGDRAPGDPAVGQKELEALPANTWVRRKPPVGVPTRGWGSAIYDPRTHTGYAWGGGHSTYPGAGVSEYALLTNRWRGMADAANYNPYWLHGMVAGPPGVSPGGWSLLPTHARKSYGIDVASESMVNYIGDVYSLKDHMFVTNIGTCPGKYGVSDQVSFCSTPHGLYGYSANLLAKADVAAGGWEKIATGGPKHDEHAHLAYDSKRDRLVHFARDNAAVWAFDFKTGQWAQEEVQGVSPGKALGDSTYIPELDAVMMVFATSAKGPEKMFFYKLDQRRWFTADYQGDALARPNTSGRSHSPVYDPQLKLVVRQNVDSRWVEVLVMRLDATSLKLTPVE